MEMHSINLVLNFLIVSALFSKKCYWLHKKQKLTNTSGGKRKHIERLRRKTKTKTITNQYNNNNSLELATSAFFFKN